MRTPALRRALVPVAGDLRLLERPRRAVLAAHSLHLLVIPGVLRARESRWTRQPELPWRRHYEGHDLAPLRKHRGPVARSESRVGDRRVRGHGVGVRPPLSGRAPGRVLRGHARAVSLAHSEHGCGCSLPERDALVFGQPVGHLGEGGAVCAVDDSQRLRALLRFAPGRNHADQHVARRCGDGRSGSSRGLRSTFVEVWLVAPFDGVQCVMHGELHHRHGPTDDDAVLAAGGRGLETGDVPVEDLVGRGLARHSEADQREQPEYTGRHLRESSRAVSDE